jgi:two-component system, NtrC family, response regulator GlrR
MKNSSIIILNPFRSPLQDQIINLFDSLKVTDYILLDSLNDNINNLQFYPTLILVLLDNCQGNNVEQAKLLDLPKTFPSTPVLSIINPKLGCDYYSICQQFSWSIYPIPINIEDIDFIISWYAKDCRTKKVESTELYLKQRSLLDVFIGDSVKALNIKNRILKIAPYDVTVLLQGETGSGKELTAKLIHFLSTRSKGPFIAVNCGAIPNELFENELFGHKKGAYTHADSTEKGLIQDADTGTLFLDEIETLPMNSQVKLLRFIDDKRYKPLGQTTFISSDVRIISASNQDLMKLVESGKFREDLFYRLSVVNIFIAPLRDRKEDIPLLAWHFVERFAKLYSKNIRCIKPEAMMYLIYYSWPGNIRELENMLQESAILCSNDAIELDNLNFTKHNDINNNLSSFQNSKKLVNEEFEKVYLNTLLKIYNGNVKKASAFAKKDRSELYRLIKKHKIEPNIYRLGSNH